MSSKIIYLSGTLTGGLNYKPYPTNEFSKGTWNFTISQLIYDCSPSTVSTKSIAVGLKCNFVKAYKYSENNEIEYHQPILKLFSVKPNTLNSIDFNDCWTMINNVSDELKFEFIDLQSNAALDLECKIYLLGIFEKMK